MGIVCALQHRPLLGCLVAKREAVLLPALRPCQGLEYKSSVPARSSRIVWTVVVVLGITLIHPTPLGPLVSCQENGSREATAFGSCLPMYPSRISKLTILIRYLGTCLGTHKCLRIFYIWPVINGAVAVAQVFASVHDRGGPNYQEQSNFINLDLLLLDLPLRPPRESPRRLCTNNFGLFDFTINQRRHFPLQEDRRLAVSPRHSKSLLPKQGVHPSSL